MLDSFRQRGRCAASIAGAFGVFLALAFSFPAHAQSTSPTAATYVMNGAVRASAVGSDGSVYIGGDFTYVGPNNGSGMPVNTSTGAVDANFPKVNGTINAVVSDESNGWYIGGSFTKVGSTDRNYLAHITKSGSTYTVDPNWNPNPNNVVRTLAYHSLRSLVYVGGDFTTIGGQTRNYLAAINTSNGTTTSFDPSPNGIVRSIMVDIDLTPAQWYGLYIGGDFTSIGGATRNYAASYCVSASGTCGDGTAVDALRTGWDPNLNGAVHVVAEHPANYNYLYLGGAFTTYGGAAQKRAALLSTDTGSKSTWAAGVDDGIVTAIVRDSSNITYLGGTFTSVQVIARNRLAALDSSAALQNWNPNANGAVNTMVLTGTTIYLGGAFTTIGGTTRNYLANVSTAGVLASWNPLIDNEGSNEVRALALSGTNLFTGGTFASIGGSTRNRLAKIGTNGTVDGTWDPNANGAVNAIAVDSTSSTTALYVGGAFTSMGGSTRNRLAKVSASTTGAVDGTWDPNANGAVNTIAVDGITIYAGGAFTTVNGATTRNRLASFNSTNGGVSSWDPNIGAAVNAIAISGTDVYVGGAFVAVNGATTRNRLAAFTTSSATASSWDPNANGAVNAIAVSGTTMYVGGAFTTIGGTGRGYFAAIGTNGTLGSWNPNATGGTAANALALNSDGSTAYLGGDFTAIGGTTRNRLASIGTSGAGTLKGWNPNLGAGVLTIARSSSTIYAGGSFTTAGGVAQNYFAQFDPPTVTLSVSGSPAAEAAGVATITATLSATNGDDVIVNLAFSGTAMLTDDYTRSGTSITVTSGNTTGTATVTAVQDALDEADETVIVDIDTVTGGTESGSQQMTVTITDDDATPTVTFSASSSSGLESASPASLAVSLSAVSGRTVTLWYWTSDGTATGMGGADYTSPCCSVVWNIGESGSKSINVTIANDTLDENDETFTVTLSSATNGALGATTVHTYTITDNDDPPTVQVSAASSSGFEGTTPATVTVTLSAVSSKIVTVNYATANGTATGGVDYTAASGTLTFSAGQTSKTVDVTIANDTLNEAGETFTFTISNPSNATLGTAVHTYTISDDDGSPVIGFSSASGSGTETTAAVNVGIGLSVVSGQDTTVNYAVTGGTATGGGVDFTLASGIATIIGGSTSTMFTISIADDALNEANETIIVTLSNAVNASLGTATYTYTITNDDAAGGVRFAAGASSGSEATTSVPITVSLSAASGQNVTVEYAVTGGTATGGGVDFTLASGTATITGGSTSTTFAITVVNDATQEADETIVITLANPTNATLGSPTTHTYTIADNDDNTPPTATVTGSPPDAQRYVSPDAIVERTLSEPLTVATVTTATVSLKRCTGTESGTTDAERATAACGATGATVDTTNRCTAVTLTGGTRISCTHDPLVTNTWYAFAVSIGVQDTAGNALVAPEVYRFKTSEVYGGTGGSNTTPPTVTTSFPTMGGANIATSTKFTLSFSMGTEGILKTGVAVVGSVENPSQYSLYELTSSGTPTGSNLCAGSSCNFVWDATNRRVTIIPPMLGAGRSYRFTVSGFQNTANVAMATPFSVLFYTATASGGSDTTAPTIPTTCGTNGTTACTSPLHGTSDVSRFRNEFTVTFSEAMDPTTLTLGTTVGLYLDANTNGVKDDAETLLTSSGLSLSFDPASRILRLANLAALTGGQRYCFYALSGASGVKDFSGNALATTFQNACFTTASVTDTTAPKLQFADVDNFKIVARFSEPMQTSGLLIGGNVNDTNVALQCPTGVTVNLSGKGATWRGESNELEIRDLGLPSSQDCQLTVTSAQDLAGNAMDTSGSPAGNVTLFRVQSSATTGGYLGTSGVQTGSGFYGGMTGETAGTFWGQPKRCAPRTTATAKSTTIECEFPAPAALAVGSQFLLTFPNGFTFSGTSAMDGTTGGARAIAATQSSLNRDLNGSAANTPTIASVVANGGSITVTTGGAAIASGEMVRFEFERITTPTTPLTDARIAIIVKDASGVKVGQTIQPAPFVVQQSGSLAIKGKVCKGSVTGATCGESDTAIANAKVFCDQTGGYFVGTTSAATTGHSEAMTDANGIFEMTGLTSGSYGCVLPSQPSVVGDASGASSVQQVSISAVGATTNRACGQGDRSDCVDFKLRDLTTSGQTLTITVTGLNDADSDADDFDVFCHAGSSSSEYGAPAMKAVDAATSGATTTTLKLQGGQTYSCGLRPHIAFEQYGNGTPPPPPTFEFLPPKSVTVIVPIASDPNGITFTLSGTSATISGTVVDGSGNGIANVYVHGDPSGCFDATTSAGKTCAGSFVQTQSDGSFTLRVSPGTYEVGADGPGLPSSTREEVTVKIDGSLTSKGTTITTVTLRMVKSSTTISGQILDESGNGITYAHVNAERRTITTGTDACNFANSTPAGGFAGSPTDRSGSFTLYASAGTWCVRAFAPSYGEVGTKTLTVSDASLTGQNIQATAANFVTISGTVTKGGSPASGAFVSCFKPGTGGNGTQSNADGTFTMKVKAGTGYTCDGFLPGVGPLERQSNVDASSNTTVTFAVGNPGTIVVTLAGLTDAFCDARNASGLGNGTSQASATGVYTLMVPAGTYTVRCGGPKYGSLVERAGVTVTAGGSTTITGTSLATRTVSGRVIDGTANVAGATLTFSDKTTGRGFVMQTGAQSGSIANFSTTIPEGTYVIRAAKQGYDPATTTATVAGADVALAAPLAMTNIAGTSGTSVTAAVQESAVAYTGRATVVATRTVGGVPKTVVAETDGTTGQAALPLANGTWILKAIGDNGKESSSTEVTVMNGVLSGSAPTLALASAITGYTQKSDTQTLSLSVGGLAKFEELAVGGRAPEVNIPASTLSTSDASTGKVEMKSDPTLKDVHAGADAKFVGSYGYDITPKDANGNAITSINGSVTVTIPYTDADVSAAGVDESKLQFASFNTASQTWETFPTTVDPASNTLTATITHFSSFGIIGSIGSGGIIGRDVTPPGIFRDEDLGALATSSDVTLMWTDPQASTLDRIEILRSVPPSSAVSAGPIGVVSKGIQRYVDRTVQSRTRYTYILRAKDADGNTRNSSEIVVETPAVEAPATTWTATPLPPAAVSAPPVVATPAAAAPTAPGAAAIALNAGDLVKSSSEKAVYRIGTDGKRHSFPNERVFRSWFADFSAVRTLTSAQVAAIPLGSPEIVRPGTWLVKLRTSPRVYTVAPDGVLRWIPSERRARELFGKHWQRSVMDIAPANWSSYRVGSTLASGERPKGS